MNRYVQSLVIALTSAAVYAGTIGYGFVYDDLAGILSNLVVTGFHDISQMWSVLALPWRPLTQLTYAVTFYFVGLNAPTFHFMNLALHAVNSLLVFGIAVLLAHRWPSPKGEGESWFPLAAGLIHATHPLYTEAVAYVWGRSSLLCALFYFGALFLTFAAFEREGRTKYFLCSAAVLSGILAWKSKEEAITLPALVLVYLAFTRNWRAAALVASAQVLFVLTRFRAIADLYWEVGQNQKLVSIGLDPSLPPFEYFLTHVKASVVYYLRLFIFPFGLNVDPDIARVRTFGDPTFIFSIAVLTALIVLGVRSFREAPMISFGLAALLVSPLTAYAVMPLADVAAEHRAYISGLGFDLIAAWLILQLPYRRFTIVAITMVLAALTVQRNQVWVNSLTLWTDAEAKSPMRIRPHVNLGEAFQNAGDLDRALDEYRHASRLNPALTPVYVNTGAIYLSRNQLDLAETALRRAAELSPDVAETYINLAIVAMRQSRSEEAYTWIERAESLNPDSYLAHFTRGDILVLLGRFGEAVGEYETAINLRPDLQILRDETAGRLTRLRERGAISK